MEGGILKISSEYFTVLINSYITQPHTVGWVLLIGGKNDG